MARHMELLRDRGHRPLTLTAGVAKFETGGANVLAGSWHGVREAIPRGVYDGVGSGGSVRPAPKVFSGAACQGVGIEHLVVGACSANIETGEVTLGQAGNEGRLLIGRLKEGRQSRPQFSLQSIAAQMSLLGVLETPCELSGSSVRSRSAVSRRIMHFHDGFGSELSRESGEHGPEYLSTMSVHFWKVASGT